MSQLINHDYVFINYCNHSTYLPFCVANIKSLVTFYSIISLKFSIHFHLMIEMKLFAKVIVQVYCTQTLY